MTETRGWIGAYSYIVAAVNKIMQVYKDCFMSVTRITLFMHGRFSAEQKRQVLETVYIFQNMHVGTN